MLTEERWTEMATKERARMHEMQGEVSRWAIWLDGDQPGWQHRVDCDTLDQTHPERCVLKQVYGDWNVGLSRALTATPRPASISGVFTSYEPTSLWVAEVTKRLQPPAAQLELAELEAKHGFGYRVRDRVRKLLHA